MLKIASRTWWKAVIRDMLQHIPPVELKTALKERYPQLAEQLVPLVDEVASKQANIKGFCKKAQDFGFGYGNTGQTNFSVPNSEGAPGPGFGQLDPSNPSTPSSSYTDFAKFRLKKKKEQIEEDERREKRKEIVNKLAAKPGEFLEADPEGMKPGETLEEIKRRVDTMNRTMRSTEKEHEITPQWSSKEQTTQEEAMGQQPGAAIPVGPGVRAPKPQVEMPKGVGDASKAMDDVRKKMKTTTDEGIKETKTLSDETKKMKNNVDMLNTSIKQLLG